MRTLPENFAIENNQPVLQPRYAIALSFHDPDQASVNVNLLLRSQEFDNASWAKSNVTVTANAYDAPDGTTTADLISDNSASAIGFVSQSKSIDSANKHTFSVYVKKDGFVAAVRFVRIIMRFTGAGVENNNICLDTSTGEYVAENDSTDVESSVELTSGFWRVRITSIPDNSSNSTCVCLIYPSFGSGTKTITNSSVSLQYGCTAWGAQLAESESALEYVATTTAAQTTGSPDSDVTWLTSHADCLVLPGVGSADRIDGCIEMRGISGFTQRLIPEEGRHTIGSISIPIMDSSGTFSDKINTKLTAGEGLRHKRIRIYKGHSALTDWADYVAYITYIVDSVTYLNGVYTIKCSDIQRTAKTRIFDPDQGVLTSSITATATSIPVTISNASSKFALVDHDAIYSANASDEVGYIKIGDEIICHDGWNGGYTALNVVERGALGTTAAVHTVTETEISQRKKVTEYVYLEMAAPKLIYALLTGNLEGQTGKTLPDNWHLDISTDFVRLSDFTAIGDDLWNTSTDAGRIVRFMGTEPTEAKKFIEKELCLWIGCFMPVYADGAIGLKRYPGILPESGYDLAIGESDIVKYGPLNHDLDALVNNILVRWNWVDRLERFTQTDQFIDSNSISKHGAADLLAYEFKGVFTGLQTDANIYNFFTAIRDRLSNPPLRHSITVLPTYDPVEVGDTVRVTNSAVRDYNSTASLDRVFGIEQIKQDWKTGQVTFDLFGGIEKSTEDTISSSNVMSDSFYTAAGTELSTVLTISADQVTANGSLTGADANTSAIFYYNGDLTINSGVTVTISRNVILRIKGTFTVNGKIDLDGNASDGAIGSSTTGKSCEVIVRHSPQTGDEISSFLRPYKPAVTTTGTYPNGAPVFNVINPDGASLTGIPTDLSGIAGGTGPSARIANVDSFQWPPAFDRSAAGGAGGAGGGSMVVVCRGMSMGPSSEIDCSGVAGSSGSLAESDDVPKIGVRGQTGGGGFPGGVLVLIDGDYTAPSFSASNITASRGASSAPGTTDVTLTGDNWVSISPGEEGYGIEIGVDSFNYWQSITRIQYIPEADNGYVWLPEQEKLSINPSRSLLELQLSSLTLDNQIFDGALTCGAARPGLAMLAGLHSTDVRIYTSTDGKTWTERSNPATTANYNAWGASYGGGYWHIVGNANFAGGFILYSTDAITWSLAATDPVANAQLNAIAYGNGLWVAVGEDDGSDADIFTSTDGTTWTERSNGKAIDLNGVCYSPDLDLWCAVGDFDGTDAYILTSPDGTAWTERSNPNNENLTGVAWGNGVFVAVGNDKATGPYIVYSDDGITWTETNYPVADEWLINVRYYDGIFVACGTYDDAVYGCTLIASEDGQYWTRIPTPASATTSQIYDIIFEGSFIALPTPSTSGEIFKSARVRVE